MEQYILDRIEGDVAVVEVTEEDDTIRHIQMNRLELPADVKEGDVLLCTSTGWRIDAETTQQRRAEMEAFLKRFKS